MVHVPDFQSHPADSSRMSLNLCFLVQMPKLFELFDAQAFFMKSLYFQLYSDFNILSCRLESHLKLNIVILPVFSSGVRLCQHVIVSNLYFMSCITDLFQRVFRCPADLITTLRPLATTMNLTSCTCSAATSVFLSSLYSSLMET